MSIVLIAVMLDRPALTKRNVALAALAILVVAPESLFDPSFEMSFAAVVALVALYEWLSERKRDGLRDVNPYWAALQRGLGLFAGAALTTLVASIAIAPFALYHFHRMTHYGLIANLLVAPLVSLVIMPMAVLSLMAMPFGLETWPLKAMGFCIDLMVDAGIWVSSWPGAVSVFLTNLRSGTCAHGVRRLVGLLMADQRQGFRSCYRGSRACSCAGKQAA